MKLPVKRIFVFLIACFIGLSSPAQSSKVKKAMKEAEKRKKEAAEDAKELKKAKLKHHLEIQTKEVRKRMKDSKKTTDYHYKHRNFMVWLSDLTNKNRKRERKHKK